MRWNRFRYPFAVLALITAAVLGIAVAGRGPRPAEAAEPQAAGKATSQPSSTKADDAAIRQAISDYVTALNKGDLDRIMTLWAPDAEYVTEDGNVTHGKQGIHDLFKEVLPQFKGQKVTSQVRSVRTLRSDVALVDGSLEYDAADGSRDRDRYTSVWVKSDGKWLISSARDLPTEATDAPSVAYPHLEPLGWLVGEWADGAPKMDVRLTCKWGPNKAYLLMDYEIRREGQEPMTVVQRIGWDAHAGGIRSWVFDSQGGFGEGQWSRDGRRWMAACSGVLPDGGTGTSTNAWEFVDANTFVWRATDREIDSQPVADVEVKFVRKAQK